MIVGAGARPAHVAPAKVGFREPATPVSNRAVRRQRADHCLVALWITFRLQITAPAFAADFGEPAEAATSRPRSPLRLRSRFPQGTYPRTRPESRPLAEAEAAAESPFLPLRRVLVRQYQMEDRHRIH